MRTPRKSAPPSRPRQVEACEPRWAMAAELGIPATFPPLAAADELASCAPLAETSAAALQQGLAACTVGIDADLHDDALETFTFDASPPPVETQDARGWTDIDSIRSTYGFRGAGQTVAVIDSGIAYDHYALGRGFGAGSKVVGGWDFAENDSNPYDDGPAGYHGTHVAGVIGSTDASYTGIAPGVDLVALRVFDDQGKSKFAWVESALQWVHAHRSDFASPITTVNLSIGAVYNSNVLPDWAMLEDEFAQLKADGIVVTVAAGNHFSKFNVAGLSYPAVSPDVIPAMAVNSAGALLANSQRASRALAAPGQSIMSTVPDYMLGSNGVPNDFSAATGTSMASPYIAGVSALLRQAFTAFGRSTITPDEIQQHLRATADSFFDPTTNASYLKINAQRAISAVAGTDAHGNTAAAATSIGGWSGRTAIQGGVNFLGDKDFVSFVADRSGTLQLQGSHAAGGTLTWTLGGTVTTGTSASLNIVAGQTYVVGVSSDVVGSYSIVGVLPDAPATSTGQGLGAVTFVGMSNVAISGEKQYALQATRTGLMTVQVIVPSGTELSLELLSANQQVVTRTTAYYTGLARFDVAVTEGQSYTVRIRGQAAAAEVKIANVVHFVGYGIELNAGGSDDQITVDANVGLVWLNGLAYYFRGLDTLTINGRDGADNVTFTGQTTASESVTASLTTTSIVSGPTAITIGGAERVQLNLQRADQLTLLDGRGDDVFVVSRGGVTMSGGGVNVAANGSSVTRIQATAGGNDVGYFYCQEGTPLVDRAQGTMTWSEGASVFARGIEHGYAVVGANVNALAEGAAGEADGPQIVALNAQPTATASTVIIGVTPRRARATNAPNDKTATAVTLSPAAVDWAHESTFLGDERNEGDEPLSFAHGRAKTAADSAAPSDSHVADHDAAFASWEDS